MRILTRSALCGLLVVLAAACGGGGETMAEPETPESPTPTPPAEPMSPAAGEETGKSTEAATQEPATPPEPAKPPPLVFKAGEGSSEVAQVLLMKDPKKKGKDKLLFLSSKMTCDEMVTAKNKSPNIVFATDVKATETGSLEMAQPMKLTYYKDGKATPINAKKEEVTLTGEGSKGTLKVATKMGKNDFAVDGPFEITTCEPPEAPAPAGKAPAGGAKAPAEGGAAKGGTAPAPAKK